MEVGAAWRPPSPPAPLPPTGGRGVKLARRSLALEMRLQTLHRLLEHAALFAEREAYELLRGLAGEEDRERDRRHARVLSDVFAELDVVAVEAELADVGRQEIRALCRQRFEADLFETLR